MNYYTVSADTWIPAAEDGAGTISCSGSIVTGSNTFFTIQVESGDWITNNGEARQVRTVNSDTDLELYKPFSSDFSGQAISIIKEDNAKNLFLGIKNKSGADITVDGESVPDGASVVKGQQNAPGFRRKFVEPVYVETTGTVLVNKQSITNRRVNATVPPSPIPTIYGLQFDGVSNNIIDPAFQFNQTGSLKATIYGIGFPNSFGYLFISSVTTNQFLYMDSSLIQVRSAGQVNNYSLSTYAPLVNVIEAIRNTSTAEVEVILNDVSLGVQAFPSGRQLSYDQFMGGLTRFVQGVVTELEVYGQIYNDANSWNGATINGATRVQSTDGGQTWTPA